MKLNEISQHNILYAIINDQDQVIKDTLTADEAKQLVNNPKLQTKYGNIRIIEDPRMNQMFKRQAGIDYKKPITDDNNANMMFKHQAS